MCDEPVELKVQCAMLEGLLLMMPLTADAAGVGHARDPTDALIRTLVPVVLRVRLANPRMPRQTAVRNRFADPPSAHAGKVSIYIAEDDYGWRTNVATPCHTVTVTLS